MIEPNLTQSQVGERETTADIKYFFLQETVQNCERAPVNHYVEEKKSFDKYELCCDKEINLLKILNNFISLL